MLSHPDAGAFLNGIRERKSRYIRDQLQLMKEILTGKSTSVTHQALEYCLKNKLFSAVDFSDALKHFEQFKMPCTSDKTLNEEIQPLVTEILEKLKTKPEVRDLEEYLKLLKGECNGVRPA